MSRPAQLLRNPPPQVDQAWRQAAACRADSKIHALMFTAALGKGAAADPDVRRAKAICGICEVRDECLDYALTTNQAFGIWGGLLPVERRRIR